MERRAGSLSTVRAAMNCRRSCNEARTGSLKLIGVAMECRGRLQWCAATDAMVLRTAWCYNGMEAAALKLFWRSRGCHFLSSTWDGFKCCDAAAGSGSGWFAVTED